jgi:hypothetical protein
MSDPCGSAQAVRRALGAVKGDGFVLIYGSWNGGTLVVKGRRGPHTSTAYVVRTRTAKKIRFSSLGASLSVTDDWLIGSYTPKGCENKTFGELNQGGD